MSEAPPQTPSRVAARWKLLVTALITAVVLALVFSRVEPDKLRATLSQADVGLVVAAALIALFFNTVQSGELVRHTLRGFGQEVSFRAALTATVGNLAIHSALPAGSGNVGRIAYLHRRHGVDLARGALSAITLLWLKLGWLFALSLVGWLLHAGSGLQAWVAAAGFAVCAAALLAAPRCARWVERHARLRDRLGKIGRVAHALAGAGGQVQPGAMLLGAAHALIAVFVELAIFWMLLEALGAQVDFVTVLAWLPLVIIGAKVPLTVMGLGTREALVVTLFAHAAPPELLLGAALLFSLVEHVLPALLGTLLTFHFVRRIVAG